VINIKQISYSLLYEKIVLFRKFKNRVLGLFSEGKCVLTFVVSELLDNNSLNCVLFDLDSLIIYGAENEYSDEVRNFLRLRGIRFKPIYWRYSGESHLYQD